MTRNLRRVGVVKSALRYNGVHRSIFFLFLGLCAVTGISVYSMG